MRKNSVPRKYRAYYIEPGLADYTAEGIGVVLVQKPALDRMMSTFVGMPVVNFEHTDKRPEDLFNMSVEEKEEIADGVVSDSGYDEKSGWYWVDMMIWDEETQNNIDNEGFSVSCAYDVTEASTEGGTVHNVDYDEEVLNGEYIHMAVVPNPRYEKAWIIKNSKTKGEGFKLMFKRKKNAPLKNQEPPKEEKKEEEVLENMEDGVVQLEDGTEIPLSELVEMYKAKKSETVENSESVYSMDDEIEIDGEKMTIKDMYNMCKSMENAEPPQDEVAKPVVDESLQNSKKEKEEGKQNFIKIKNAANTGENGPKIVINSVEDRVNKGISRYGSKVRQVAK